MSAASFRNMNKGLFYIESLQAHLYRQAVHGRASCPSCSNTVQTRHSTSHRSADSSSAYLLAGRAVQGMVQHKLFLYLAAKGAVSATCIAHLLARKAVWGVGRQLIHLILSITQVVHAPIVHDVVVFCESGLCLLQQQHTKEARQEREPQQSMRQLLVIICARTGPAVTAAGGVSGTAEPGRCGSPCS